MRKLSLWAKQNPWKARIFIVISHALLILLALYVGSSLSALNIVLPGTLFFIFILYYLAAVFVYPDKKEKNNFSKQWYYARQKACDFSLAAAAFGMFICIANSPGKYLPDFNPVLGITSVKIDNKKEKPTAAEILESLKSRDKSTLTREEKRILKKEFKVQMKNYIVSKIKGNKEDGDKSGLIVLAIIGALGLLSLLAALACNLSCNGNDGAAALVAILGTAAIIVGLVFVIKSIRKRSSQPKEQKAMTAS